MRPLFGWTTLVAAAAAVPLLLGPLGCHRGPMSTESSTANHPPIAAETQATAGQPFGQAAPPFTSPPVLTGTPDVAALAEKVRTSVVNVTTSTAARPGPQMIDPFDFFFGPGNRPPGMIPGPGQEGPSSQRRALGSGFIIDPTGYVVTNNHVIEDADDITVRLADDRTFKVDLVGRDPKLDIALLKLKGATDLPTASFGDSDALRVGEYVVAVGNPFGLGQTVTMGIVSAKDRTIGAGPYDDFIQTDASINPGNSGGPLFNLRGEVVGINTAIHAQGQGIGFAIPINIVRDVLTQLRTTGHVTRGKLGIVFQSVTEDIARAMGLERQRGALVAEVEPGGPADRAGIKAGDLITKVENQEVTDSNQLPRLVARNAPGTRLNLTYRRSGKEFTTSATLGALEGDSKGIERSLGGGPGNAPSGGSSFGLNMMPGKSGGVVVTGVQGAIAGKLAPQDTILSIDGKAVSSPADVTQALTRASQQKRPALVQVRRQGRTQFVAIDVPPAGK